MRIISGEMRGRVLKSLPGLHTRPTSEKVKEALFSIIQFEIEGRRVLDLFAGSGQLGIEALSRGARECVFVESDRAALAIVKENLEKTKLIEKAKLNLTDFESFLRRGEKFDIILADPPYRSDFYEKILHNVSKFDTLNINGIIIVESEKETVLPEGETLRKGREYRYGQTKLTLYHRDIAEGDTEQ